MVAMEQTRERILEVAEKLLLTRGYAGFSYADIAAEINIRKASIHYHFAAKGDLGIALVQRQQEQYRAWLAALNTQRLTPAGQLDAWFEYYMTIFRSENRICINGMLSSQIGILPEGMQAAFKEFLHEQHAWLKQVLKEGITCGNFAFKGSPGRQAMIIGAALQGAAQIAHVNNGGDLLSLAIEQIKLQIQG